MTERNFITIAMLLGDLDGMITEVERITAALVQCADTDEEWMAFLSGAKVAITLMQLARSLTRTSEHAASLYGEPSWVAEAAALESALPRCLDNKHIGNTPDAFVEGINVWFSHVRQLLTHMGERARAEALNTMDDGDSLSDEDFDAFTAP